MEGGDDRSQLLAAVGEVGSLLDVGNYVPDSHFDEIFELGTAYIRAVYPLIGPISTQLSVDIPPQ
jgi:hypothetical protein